MADTPVFDFPAASVPETIGDVELHDRSDLGKWRTWSGPTDLSMGMARRVDGELVFSVSPGEWIVVGRRPSVEDTVDLTHVRALITVAGQGARRLLSHVCALDLGDLMTPDGAAVRSLVAGVATEIVREDDDGAAAYHLLMSRSFAAAVWERLAEVAGRLQP